MTLPKIPLNNGYLRSLLKSDAERILFISQQQDLPGRPGMVDIGQAEQLIQLAEAVFRQQAGCIWGVENEGQLVGLLHFYEWQPEVLRGSLRLDAAEQCSVDSRVEALQAAHCWLRGNWNVHTFVKHVVEGQSDLHHQVCKQLGFIKTACLRDYWRLSDDEYRDVDYYCDRYSSKGEVA